VARISEAPDTDVLKMMGRNKISTGARACTPMSVRDATLSFQP